MTVPAVTLKQFVTFRPVTVTAGLTTTVGADFEADATWQGATVTGDVQVGAGVTVTVAGASSLASGALQNSGTVVVSAGLSMGYGRTFANAGTVRFANGGGLTTTMAMGSAAWVFTNSGLVEFADQNGVTISGVGGGGGRFVNLSSGVVSKTGPAAVDTLYLYPQGENDGTVTVANGALSWTSSPYVPSPVVSGDGYSDGVFTTTGTGHLDFGALVSAAAVFGPNVWVTADMRGTVTLPTGVTLNVGNDPATAANETGTIYAATTGAGTLHVVSGGTVAGDVDNSVVEMLGGTLSAPHVGSGTTVSVTGSSMLGGSVANAGTIVVSATWQMNGSLTNSGTVRLANGGNIFGYQYAGSAWTLVNSGLIEFADSAGATISYMTPNYGVAYGGRFVNTSSGVVSKTGSAAVDSISFYPQGENDGTVTASSGALSWYSFPYVSSPVSGDGYSDGAFTTTGSGHLGLAALVSASATYGSNVWVTGDVRGAATLPTGTTLNVGNDPGTTANETGTVYAPTTGPGTLHVISGGTVAGNVSNPVVEMLGGTLSAPTVSSGTTVSVTASSMLSGSVANAGTIVVSATWQMNGSLSNSGTVRLVDGGKIFGYQYAGSAWTLVNSGLIEFADSVGATISYMTPNNGVAYGGRFVNTSSGVVSKTGSAAVDSISFYPQGENDGTVSTSNGLLSWYSFPYVSSPVSGDGASDGAFTTTGSGHLGLAALVSASATFGPNVWVTGDVRGAVTLPAGTTLQVGNDPATTANETGTVYAPTTGAGTLRILSGGTASGDVSNPVVELVGGTLSTPHIGSATAVSVTASSMLSGSVANAGTIVVSATWQMNGSLSNSGTVRLVDGGKIFGYQYAGSAWTLVNSGLIEFADSVGATISYMTPNNGVAYGGRFVNTSSGVVSKTGSAAVDSISFYPQGENDGIVTVANGALSWYSFPYAQTPLLFGDGISDGAFTTTGSGHLGLAALVSASATFGPNVWVTGDVRGAVTLPAGTTLHVGNDPATTATETGTVYAPTTGAGTLHVISGGTAAGDLNNSVVEIAGGTLSAPHVSTATAVSVTASSMLSGSVANAGTIVVSATWQMNGSLTNSGTVRLVDGGKIFGYQYAGSAWSLVNSGLIEFADSVGATISYMTPNNGVAYGGRFVNTSSGVVSKTGSAAVDSISFYPQGENDGTVTAASGALSWYSFPYAQTPLVAGDGSSDGAFTTTGSGHLGLAALVSAAATYGPNVWVTGDVRGAVTLPAGTTLNVGNDPATTATETGTLFAPTTGAGTLHVVSGGTLAGDVSNPVVEMLGGTLSTPHVGSGTTVSVTGASMLGGSVANAGTIIVSATWQMNGSLTTSGTVRLVDGGKIFGYQYAGSAWTLVNSGLIEFADSVGATISYMTPNNGVAYGGRFVNTSSGTVSKTGTAAVDSIWFYPQGENDGTVTAASGALSWYSFPYVQTPLVSGDGISDGAFTTTGTGHIGLAALVSAAATYGPNVWVTGDLRGTVTLPAGTTLNVGNDPATTATETGTVYAPTTGAGILHVASGGTVAVNLDVASVQMDAGSTIARKADQTTTVISALTTVTLSGTPSLGSGLALTNNGVLDFGANGYFACTNCTIRNANDLIVANLDGMPTHVFDASKGTFVNTGTIVETGYYPGVALWFGIGLNRFTSGEVVMHNMSQSPWVQSVRDNQLTQILNALTPNFLGQLAALLHQQSLTIGYGACGDVSAAAGIGVTVSVCLVIGPNSKEALAVTLGANVGGDGGFSATVGDYVLWRTGAAGETMFDAYVDMDGPFVCQAASFEEGGGVATQHCWGPVSDVPFSLNDPLLSVTTPGVHTGYLGGGVGISAGASMGVSYTVTVSCTTFTSLTWHQCPPINTAAPTISGTAAVGQTVTSSTGTWDPRLPDSLSYRWRRCTTSSPSSCSDIPGATASQYLVTSADKGLYLAVYVVGDNDGTLLTSSLSGLVYVPVPAG